MEIFYHFIAHLEDRVVFIDKLTHVGVLSTLDPVMDNLNFCKFDICDRDNVFQLFEGETISIVTSL